MPHNLFASVMSWFNQTWASPQMMIATARPEYFDIRQHCPQNPRIIHYLIPCMAAVNTLHSIRQDESRESELLPSAYQANVAASSTFRRMERDVNMINWPSVGLFIICHLMFHFGIAKSVAASEFDYLEIFQHVLRGSNETRNQIVVHLRRTGLFLGDTHVPVSRYLATRPTYNAETRRALKLLASARHPECTSDVTIAACNQALELLKEWAIAVDGHPSDWTQIFHWPCAVSPTFVSMLRERQSVATLIFIHWCAIMHHAPKAWFLDGWAQRTAFAAMAKLPATDYGLLRWPMMVFDQGAVRRGRLCLTMRADLP
ncbi:hypothetical protein HD806DRAFT_406373 [Xylariaceae sp. AK1471]|nr:hypothetical protein HD806DRAFT_406373 [Xylariaceae sp. AK1471]